MNKPLLSICIPTYNRGPFLAEVLDSIDKQVADEALYEVCVSDNASNDESEALFNQIAHGRVNWKWRKNERNLGGRANVRLCTKDAVGEYIWIISSDDVVAPNSVATLLNLVDQMKATKASAALLLDRLPARYENPVPLDPVFSWLRHASINIPAFVGAVVWKAPVWFDFQYEKYPAELSLPQLDGFLDACMDSTILGLKCSFLSSRAAEDTTAPTFWFYRRHAIVDVFEYPLLYKKVLRSPRMDFSTRVMIWMRRAANLRHIRHKLIFMRYNEQYYHTRAADLKAAHSGTLAWPFLYVYAKATLEWKRGKRVAERRYKGTEKLPARDRPEAEF